MIQDYSELVKLAYEIEGLLILQAQRGENAVAMVDEMLAEKIAMLARPFKKTEDDEIAESAIEEENIMAEQPSEIQDPQSECPPAPSPRTTAPELPAEEETPLTLDEKLARQRAKDLFKAFTINDKFRFRRELFRDSQEEFDDALDVISQMSTIEEAEEYMYDDLCLDPDSDDVKAFMDVIIKHF